jgi:hypothetical protein
MGKKNLKHIAKTDISRFVRTPLWTDYPEKMKQFGYTMENTITADTVAVSMIDLVQGAEYVGGSCMEVSSSGRRLLGTWNIPEPPAEGTSIPKEVIELNYRPVQATLQAERKGLVVQKKL